MNRARGLAALLWAGLRTARQLRAVLAGIALCCAAPAVAIAPDQGAAALHARYASIAGQLDDTAFGRPLLLESTESSDVLQGDIYARVDYPFATVSAALNDPAHWCDIMILHINTKYCRASGGPDRVRLSVKVGKKTPQPIEETHPIEFSYHVAAATPGFLAIRLDAPQGPMGTRDYRIRLHALPVDNGQTFLHLTYAYEYGVAGRIAMQAYLASVGRNKVGFTPTGAQSGGEAELVGGMRGVAERNTMRYYLAIDAYLGARATAPASQFKQRLQHWFTATEQYPRQLRELDRTAYLEMKRGEYRRQQTLQ